MLRPNVGEKARNARNEAIRRGKTGKKGTGTDPCRPGD
jgi:hypothetical protein